MGFIPIYTNSEMELIKIGIVLKKYIYVIGYPYYLYIAKFDDYRLSKTFVSPETEMKRVNKTKTIAPLGGISAV